MCPKKAKTKNKDVAPNPNNDELNEKIKAKAFELFEKRGCCHGGDCDDWYEAEKIVTQSNTK